MQSVLTLARGARRTSGRTRVVPPHSARSETLWVGGLALLIIAAMTLRFVQIGARPAELQLKPYQRLDDELSETAHLVYRALLASVADVEQLRAEEGQWPEAILLEEDGIPPFVRPYMPVPADGLQWVSYDGGSWVDYLGTDTAGRHRVSYILRLIDLHAGYHPHPHPGIDYDPERLVAAQVWIFDEAGRLYPGERLPEAGWTWVLSRLDPIARAPSGRIAPRKDLGTE